MHIYNHFLLLVFIQNRIAFSLPTLFYIPLVKQTQSDNIRICNLAMVSPLVLKHFCCCRPVRIVGLTAYLLFGPSPRPFSLERKTKQNVIQNVRAIKMELFNPRETEICSNIEETFRWKGQCEGRKIEVKGAHY